MNRVLDFIRSIEKPCGYIKSICLNIVSVSALSNSLSDRTSQPAALLKKRFWHRCFPVKFAKFLRTHFFYNTSGRLLLYCTKQIKFTTFYCIKIMLTQSFPLNTIFFFFLYLQNKDKKISW